MRFARVVFAVSAVMFSAGLVLTAQSTPSPATAAQTAKAQTAAPPAYEPAYRLPPDKLAMAVALDRIRIMLAIGGSLWGVAVLWILLATRAAASLESIAKRFSRFRWIQGLMFFATFFVITTIASLPLDMAGHIASRHYGISIQGWAGWFGDQAKALALLAVIGSLVCLLFHWIVKAAPLRYWLWCWLITLPMLALVTFIGPVLIEPLFDKFEPLSEHHAELVADLEKVAARTGTNIPPERMFLIKASEKTNGLNAYVSGMGATKRIVVWDTTAGRVPNEVVMLVFGHESGHYVLHHIAKGLAAAAVFFFFVYWACAHFSQWLVRRNGARWGIAASEGIAPLATRTGFVVLVFAFSIAIFITQPISNGFSRALEHQADVYGQEAIHGLVADPQKTAVAGFNALGEAWLENPNPNSFIEFWLYDHPSVKNRAEFAAHYDPWANGGHGEFFWH
jgi:Zn-dependent protease with chaperone function